MSNAKKERPILFSGPMVRAILDGRKSQTRRIMKEQPDDNAVIKIGELGSSLGVAYIGNERSGGICTRVPCPYGQPGDLLWVRETWGVVYPQYIKDADEPTFYRVDYTAEQVVNSFLPKWRPSIHMPRNRSRLTLRITNVRVERLQEISQSDVFREGLHNRQQNQIEAEHGALWPQQCYRVLWESINGKGSWDANPWVWVIEFERVEQRRAAA